VRLDPRRDAIPEQRAVWNDDRGPPAPGTLKPPHYQLQKQQCRLGRAPVIGKVVEDACLLLTAEGRVGQDDVDPLVLADLSQAEAKSIAGVDAWGMQAVQQEVELGQQERQRLGLAAEEAVLLEDSPLLDRIGL